MDWYPWYFTLFKADTMDLDPFQDGCYRRLIDHYMETRSPLPASDMALARIIGVGCDEWLEKAAAIVRPFFIEKSGKLFHKFCDNELDIQDKKSKKRSKSAKKAAKKRWENYNENQDVECDSHAERIPSAMRNDATGQYNTSHSNKDRDSKIDSEAEIKEAVGLYNILANDCDLSKVQIISDKRKSGVRARLKECGGMDGWKDALAAVRASDFLIGKKADWKCDLDFIIRKDKFISIMEGKYKNGKSKRKESKSDQADRELQEYLDRNG